VDRILKQTKSELLSYFFILPYFALFALVYLFPMIYSFYISFTNYRLGKPMTFTGLENYFKAFTDPIFLEGFKNVFLMILIQMPIMLGISLVLAVLINMREVRFKIFWRTTITLPVLTSLVTASIMWYNIFGANFGLLNKLLMYFGLKPLDWFHDPTLALGLIFNNITWRWIGWNMLILLAGLQAIPLELYEAARIDGSGYIQTFRYITLPLIKPSFIVALTFSIVGSINTFDEVYVLTGGGPGYSTYTVLMRIYDAFTRNFWGYSAALSWIVATVSFIASYFYVKRMFTFKVM
jgi:lactose/L-arabinose transport system permease protein